MVKDYNHALRDFLVEPENLRTAFEIGEQLPNVKSYFAHRFWDRLGPIVEEKLGGSSPWTVDPVTGDDADKSWAGLSLISFDGDGKNYLEPRIEQQITGVVTLLSFGIRWGVEEPETDTDYADLVHALQGNLKKNESTRGNQRWPGWIDLPYKLSDLETCLKLTEGTAIEDGLADSFIRLVENYQKDILVINQQIHDAEGA